MKSILLIMMGGSGTRMGSDIPKQYIEVSDRPIFYHIVRAYAEMEEVEAICIVSHNNWLPFVRKSIADIPFHCEVIITAGGDTRSASVRNGLHAVEGIAEAEDVILIHDATHPYVDRQGTREVIRYAHELGGATLGAYQYDTCYQMDAEGMIQKVVPRQELVSGASPEAFRYGEINRIYFGSTEKELSQMTSAGAIALAHGIPMKVVPANVLNLKLTYPGDLELFKVLADTYFFG